MRPGFTKPRVKISQTYGTVLDAIPLAVYLAGHRPTVLDFPVANPNWSPSADVFLNRPIISGGFLTKENAGHGDVWCVTTDLGTWTVHETPGHAPSHVCLFQPERRLLISGDHLLGRVSPYFDVGYSPDPAGESVPRITR